ncbi:MAG TPA: VCBS repeat-containing protein [Actinomycetota bacterium]|nr:VCBS repeat-containing protein [Actinomycetota bacterium]
MFLLTLLITALLPAAPADAASFGILPGFPTIQIVGEQSVPAHVRIVNSSKEMSMTVTDILVTPACSNWHIDCAGGTADPGVFTFSPTGTGAPGTNCANKTFNITVANPLIGQMRFRQADNQNVVLEKVEIANDLDVCEIRFTVKANRAPLFDSHVVEGVQANQNLAAFGVLQDGTRDYIENNDITTFHLPARTGEPPAADFDGDGRTDISFYRRSTGIWWIKDAARVDWGGEPSDIVVPADYDDDGKTNVAVYRRATGIWYIQGMNPVNWGSDPSDQPVPGDYDGNGTPNLAVYRGATGVWYIQGMNPVNLGGDPSDVPVPADYDADGVTDLAIYRASTGMWYFENAPMVNWGGVAGDVPIPADYDGDGDAEIAVYRPSTGMWYIQGMPVVNWGGVASDVPAPGDYDGDGDAEIAVYRVSTGIWYIQGLPAVNYGWDQNDRPTTAPSSLA